MKYDIGKIKNIKELLGIGEFGVPPSGESLNKEEYIKMLKETDKTFEYENKDGYHIVKKVRHEHINPGRENWDVEYRLNSDLFRSDHFKKEHDGLHIVFSGCSSTEGVGIKQEHTWAYKTYDELSKTKKIDGYYNLGQSNSGYHQIIGNFLTYVEKYGKPDYLFVLLPNIQRRYKYLEEENYWEYVSYPQPGSVTPTEGPRFEIDDYISVFPAWAKTWQSFINYCKANKIKLFWSTWDATDRYHIELSSLCLESFVAMDIYNDQVMMIGEMLEAKNITKKEIYARDNHPGPLVNSLWSKNFLNELKKDGKF
jgi:hypothetical protein